MASPQGAASCLLVRSQPVFEQEKCDSQVVGTDASAASIRIHAGPALSSASQACEPLAKAFSDQIDLSRIHAATAELRSKTLAGLDSTADALRSRIQTLMAGKQLLDIGGESAVRALQAKQASVEVAKLDGNLLACFSQALESLDRATQKLGETNSAQELALGDLCGERLKMYQQLQSVLAEPPSSLSISACETDALVFVNARSQVCTGVETGYQILRTKTGEGFEVLKAGAVKFSADCSSKAAPTNKLPRESMVSVRDLPDKFSEHLHDGCRLVQDKARTQFNATVDVMSDRMDTARIGRQLLTTADEDTLLALSAKKAAIDAATHDADVVSRARNMAREYAASASKLIFAATQPHDEFATLAEEHAGRARLYEEVAELLADPLPSPDLSGPEQDACSMLHARELGALAAAHVMDGADVGFKLAKSKAVVGAEFVKDQLFPTQPSMKAVPCM